MRGQLKDAKHALVAGADINSQDYNRKTPLHLASLRNHQDIVDFLLHQEANINIGVLAGDTASSLASKMSHWATTKQPSSVQTIIANLTLFNGKSKLEPLSQHIFPPRLPMNFLKLE